MAKIRKNLWFRASSIAKAADYVYEKYGTLHAKLGEFISDCIDYYFETKPEPFLHTHTQQQRFRTPTMRKVLKICLALREHSEISDDELNKIITEIVGGDPRTLKKYRTFLMHRRVLIPDRKTYIDTKTGKRLTETEYKERPSLKGVQINYIYRVNHQAIDKILGIKRESASLAVETAAEGPAAATGSKNEAYGGCGSE